MSPKVRSFATHETAEPRAESAERELAERERSHKERFRASLEWALVEHAKTLEKLAK
jgi:hypothetical protein